MEIIHRSPLPALTPAQPSLCICTMRNGAKEIEYNKLVLPGWERWWLHYHRSREVPFVYMLMGKQRPFIGPLLPWDTDGWCHCAYSVTKRQGPTMHHGNGANYSCEIRVGCLNKRSSLFSGASLDCLWLEEPSTRKDDLPYAYVWKFAHIIKMLHSPTRGLLQNRKIKWSIEEFSTQYIKQQYYSYSWQCFSY